MCHCSAIERRNILSQCLLECFLFFFSLSEKTTINFFLFSHFLSLRFRVTVLAKHGNFLLSFFFVLFSLNEMENPSSSSSYTTHKLYLFKHPSIHPFFFRSFFQLLLSMIMGPTTTHYHTDHYHMCCDGKLFINFGNSN